MPACWGLCPSVQAPPSAAGAAGWPLPPQPSSSTPNPSDGPAAPRQPSSPSSSSSSSPSSSRPGLSALAPGSTRPIDRLRYQAKLLFEYFDKDQDGRSGSRVQGDGSLTACATRPSCCMNTTLIKDHDGGSGSRGLGVRVQGQGADQGLRYQRGRGRGGGTRVRAKGFDTNQDAGLGPQGSPVRCRVRT